MPLPAIFLFIIFALLGWAGPTWSEQASVLRDEAGSQWLEIAEHRLWLPLAKDWSWKRQDRGGLLTLEISAPRNVAAITIWGGNLGRRLKWQQLAQVWRERSSALGNMSELVDTPNQAQATGIPGLEVQYQTWFGRVAGQPTITKVGYLVDGERAYVLMGIWLAGDNDRARLINRQLEGLRLVRPESLANPQQPAITRTENRTGTEAETKTGQQLPRALPPLPEGASSKAEAQATEQPTITDQLPTPRLAPEAPRQATSPEPELRAPLPVRPMVRNLQLKQATAGQAISRWQEQLDFSANAFNLPEEPGLEALWLLNGTKVFARHFVQPKAESLAFELKAPQGLFPAGDYRLQLNLKDSVLAELDFQLQDPSEAELIALAEQGNAKAQLGLYAYLEMGRLKHLTKAEALAKLRQAAEQGLPMAQYLLGLVYLEGRHDQPKDAAKAMDWFHAAALQEQPEAAHALAMGYRTGLGLAKNQQEAFIWSKKAAELGYAPSAFFLGMHYLLGRGIDKDEGQARHWLGKAAEQGDSEAQAVLRHLDELKTAADKQPPTGKANP